MNRQPHWSRGTLTHHLSIRSPLPRKSRHRQRICSGADSNPSRYKHGGEKPRTVRQMLYIRRQPIVNTSNRQTETTIRPVHNPQHPPEPRRVTKPETEPRIQDRLGAWPHGHSRKRKSGRRSQKSSTRTNLRGIIHTI